MQDSVSLIILVMVLVLLMILLPLYNIFERQDNMSYDLVLKATSNFIDEVRIKGYLNQEMYSNYIGQIASTGNLYDVQLEAYKKILIKTGKDTYDVKYLIEYNDDIFSDIEPDNINTSDKVLRNDIYYLNKGDKIYIRVKNTNTTMADTLFNNLTLSEDKPKISINYGGSILGVSWKKEY